MQEKVWIEEAMMDGAHQLGLNVSPFIMESFIIYLDLLRKWNAVYNLTALKDVQSIIIGHFLDSMTLIPYLEGHHILDIGTGAGFPGMVLAILCSDKQYVLLDSVGKKTRFLFEVKRTLGLNNVTIVQERVENFISQDLFSTIISRGVGSIGWINHISHHLCQSQGIWLHMKGEVLEKELEGLSSKYDVVFHDPKISFKKKHYIVSCRQKG